jgi:predicted Zn-dependent protease
MKLTRRQFITGIAGATAAGGLVSLVRYLAKQDKEPAEQEQDEQEEKKPITFYVALAADTNYMKEGFELAKEYFKERIGLDVEFVYCKENEIPELDHLTRFALVETNVEKMAENKYKGMADYDVNVDKDIEERVKRLKEQGKEPAAATEHDEPKNFRDLMRMSDEEFDAWVKKEWKDIYKDIGAEADGKASTVHLLPCNEFTGFFGPRNKAILNAKTIVHEIGHLAGLWHTFQYVNDDLEDRLPDQATNVMSYKMPLLVRNRKYGFDMTEEQVKQMQDYFKGGETYKRLEEHGFEIADFIKTIAKERGYKEK